MSRVGGAGDFAALQQRLLVAWEANRIGSDVPHVMVVLPSYSIAETLLEHYGERIAPLEHRYLVACLSLPRYRNCEMVFVTCQAPEPEVLDHYFNLLPVEERDQARRRFRLLVVDDPTPRAVARKLLERPDLLEALRSSIGERLAYIEPWNVGPDEVRLALALDLPLYGTAPELWPLGYPRGTSTADSDYADELGRYGVAVGEVLRHRGVLGRLSVDFVATRGHAGWSLYGLELNLRKGGTTHPFAVLRHLARGNYEPGTGALRAPGGPAKYYCASDNMVDPAWQGLAPGAVIKAVDAAGLTYDRARGTGVVLHMLSCLAVDGRFGLTAIGDSPEQAADFYEATGALVGALL